MIHLNLERTRTEDDASNNLIIAILLDQWTKWDIYSLFHEPKVIQEHTKRTKAKRSVDEYKKIDENLSTGKFSNSARSHTGETVSCDLSLTNTDDKNADLVDSKNIQNHAKQL